MAGRRVAVAKSTAGRLNMAYGWRGVTKDQRVRTTVPDPSAARAPDPVRRQFKAAWPGQLHADGTGEPRSKMSTPGCHRPQHSVKCPDPDNLRTAASTAGLAVNRSDSAIRSTRSDGRCPGVTPGRISLSVPGRTVRM